MVLASCAYSQDYIPDDTHGGLTIPTAAVGSPMGSYSLSGFETINLYNGALSVNIPLLKVGGRGEAGYTISVSIQQGWGFTSFYDTVTNEYSFSPYQNNTGGDPYGPGMIEVRSQYHDTVQCNPDGNPNDVGFNKAKNTLTTLAFVLPDGTTTNLVDQLTGGAMGGYSCGTAPLRGTVFQSRDGSDLTYIADAPITDSVSFEASAPLGTGTLIFKNGVRYRWDHWTFPGGYQGVVLVWIRDRNGNQITFDYDSNGFISHIADSLNRIITITRQSSLDTITYKGANGVDRSILVRRNGGTCLASGYGSETYTQLFGASAGGSITPNLCPVRSIDLPNADPNNLSATTGRYGFLYNSFGEVAQITLPTGGVFKYRWVSGLNRSSDCTNDVQASLGDNGASVYNITTSLMYLSRRVRCRDVYADSAGTNLEQHTKYSVGLSSGDGVSVDHYADAGETIPLAHEVHYFYGNYANQVACPAKPAWFPSWMEGREYQVDELSADGQATLRSTVHTWQQGNCAPGDYCRGTADVPTCSLGPTPTMTATNPTIQQTQTKLVDTNQFSKVTFSYDGYSNRTATYEYDYGSGSPGSLLRYTMSTYIADGVYDTISSGVSASPHLPGLLSEQTVYSSTGSVIADTQYCYDQQSGCSASLASVTSPSGYVAPTISQRGNVGSISRKKSGNTYIQSSFAYDATGRVVSSTDPNGLVTSYSYADNFSTGTTLTNDFRTWQNPPPCANGCAANAFLTQITDAMGYIQKATYDYYIGEATAVIDTSNSSATTSYTFSNASDKLDRLTNIAYPDSGNTAFTYSDSTNTVSTTSTFNSGTDLCGGTATTKTMDLQYDGLGRQSQTLDDATNVIVETQYDHLGRVFRVSFPHLKTDTAHWTTTTFDSLSRPVQVQTDDLATLNYAYSGNVTTSRDQAGKWHKLSHDAAGRLTQVIEDPPASLTPPGGSTIANAPVPPAGSLLNLTTAYTYDELDDLTAVSQSGITRSFNYDALKHLLYAFNPESGGITFDYYLNGSLKSRQDGRFTTNYVYDKLYRPIQKTYTDPGTPTVSLCYDGAVTANSFDGQTTITCSGATAPPNNVNAKRRLTFETNGNSASAYSSFDSMGRVLSYIQITNGVSYQFSYTYNLAGGLSTETYPSGRAIATCYDSDARLLKVQKGFLLPAAAYATVNSYAPHGAITNMTLGNTVVEQTTFDANRLQPLSISAGSLLTIAYTYAPTNMAAANNGNVLTQSITRGSRTWNQAYTYDALNRLKTAQETGTWTESYEYDSYGNRWLCVANQQCPDPVRTGLPDLTFESPISQNQFNANNQIVGWGYDATGNVTQIGGMARTFTYDAENRQRTANISGDSNSYAYDGEGRRVTRTTPWNHMFTTTVYVYDAMGQLAAEYGQPTDTDTRYLTTDTLGSTRLETDSSGALVQNLDYLPLGQEIGAGTAGRDATFSPGFYPSAPSGQSLRFTGKERDSETGLDFFGARYFSGAQGRWTSPDLVNVTNDRLLSPSNTLNKYVYGGNNPLKYMDPDGRDITVFYESGYPSGHIMMSAYNEKTNDFAFLSVGPQTHEGILTHPFEGVPGTSAFKIPQSVDELRQNFSSLTIQTSPEVAQQAIDAIRNGAGTGNWALLGNNCTSSCAKVLKEVGLSPGSNGGLAWTPDKLWANLNLLYGKKRPPGFVRSILGPTIGGSPLLTPSSQPGKDFGNPRYGMNVFDWLMLQLKAPVKSCVTVTDSATGTTSTECH